MIVYHSKTMNTQLMADTLAVMTKEKAFELEPVKATNMFSLLFHCLFSLGLKVKELPSVPDDEGLTLCSPIWAAGITPYCMCFLKKGNVDGRKINLLLTCSNEDQKHLYVNRVKKFLEKRGFSVGAVYITHMNLHPKPTFEQMVVALRPFVAEMNAAQPQNEEGANQ